MSRWPSRASTALLALLSAPRLGAEEGARSVEEVARSSRGAVVVIRSSDRAGEARGAGSGFVIKPDGLLVTSLHVIGEGRPFTAALEDGTAVQPTGIAAFDRAGDLVLIELERKDLPGLELGDSDALRPGQTVLAVGNPLGLGLSVARGTVAETREVEGRRLIQVAMPIEPGSSGSPLIDLEGRAVGVIAIKSGASTGFAVPSSELIALLERRRVLPLERWLRMGALDPEVWRPVLGGDWRMRSGKLVSSGVGPGFGGRTLCLREGLSLGADLDLSVEVRLEDESGAAGLAFSSDGGDRHYGFYPTAGSLRLTRFEGPDVFSWTILRTVSSDRYRPGEWNEVRVRVRGARIVCLVNGYEVIDLEDRAALPPGKAGLVKFREPRAELRRFRAARELPAEAPSELAARAAEVAARIAAARETDSAALEELAALGEEGFRALRDRAAALERDAARIRAAVERSRERAALRRLEEALGAKDEEVDLLRAALLVARLDDPDLEVEPYVELVEHMGRKAREKLEGKPEEKPDGKPEGEARLAALLEHFVQDLGFRGSAQEYYHRSNSFLSDVIDDREGIPITLSVVFLEIARRAGVPAAGVAAPRHFLVRSPPAGAEPALVDAFGGRIVTRAEAEALCGRLLAETDLAPAPKRGVVVRMIHNLLGIAQREGDGPGALRYLDAVVALDGAAAGPERWMRAVLRFRSGDRRGASEDLRWLLEHGAPPGVDRAEVEDLLRAVEGGG
ncbi:MAG: trypsin-like peptidase domain-containing protein [Planctomycetes bacterium]|nr:trypsin-like peptidase domain-containing protein [Planctomycetota bacterium]